MIRGALRRCSHRLWPVSRSLLPVMSFVPVASIHTTGSLKFLTGRFKIPLAALRNLERTTFSDPFVRSLVQEEKDPHQLMEQLPLIIPVASAEDLSSFLMNLTVCYYREIWQDNPWMMSFVQAAYVQILAVNRLDLLKNGVASHPNMAMLHHNIEQMVDSLSPKSASEMFMAFSLLGCDATLPVLVKLLIHCRKEIPIMDWEAMNNYYFTVRNMPGPDYTGMRAVSKRALEFLEASTEIGKHSPEDLRIMASLSFMALRGSSSFVKIVDYFLRHLEEDSSKKYVSDLYLTCSILSQAKESKDFAIYQRAHSVLPKCMDHWYSQLPQMTLEECHLMKRSIHGPNAMSLAWIALQQRCNVLLTEDAGLREIQLCAGKINMQSPSDLRHRFVRLLRQALPNAEFEPFLVYDLIGFFINNRRISQLMDVSDILEHTQVILLEKLKLIFKLPMSHERILLFFILLPLSKPEHEERLYRVLDWYFNEQNTCKGYAISFQLLLQGMRSIHHPPNRVVLANILEMIPSSSFWHLNRVLDNVKMLRVNKWLRGELRCIEESAQLTLTSRIHEKEYPYKSLSSLIYRLISLKPVDRPLVHKLFNVLMELNNTCIEAVCTAIDTFMFCSYYSEPYCENVENLVIQECDTFDPFRLGDLVMYLTQVTWQPKQPDCFEDACIRLLDRVMKLDQPHFTITFLSHLVQLQVFPEAALHEVFSSKFFNSLQEQTQYLTSFNQVLASRHLHCINLMCNLERPHFDVPWLFQDSSDENRYLSNIEKGFEREVSISLSLLLKEDSPELVMQSMPMLSYFVLLLTKFNKLRIVGEDSENNIDQRVAVVPVSERHYCFDNTRQTGSIALTERALLLQGYKVALVPYFEWNRMALWDPEAKSKYLLKKIAAGKLINSMF
ncbi:hypothetical protein CAPTEDRAFT_220636 [Capitella teleta]|uniref:RAP domain-containing protein n=1 Tax=Capitella teleta TaxID=283909 RepID=R7TE80_CAPTE|nr:hypothetical protein CAPTEDRAFT_220636 [Capitella teleta]|eukprot:ELT91792.1 hypothetical protein CAPTEDRAFT_220636 [Capitella teleta]